MRPKSLITSVVLKKSKLTANLGLEESRTNRIYLKDCETNDGAEESYDTHGKRNVSLGVSFGRRVNPVKDRQAERRLIIERRRHIDSLIAGGLRSAGIELDPEEKRL